MPTENGQPIGAGGDAAEEWTELADIDYTAAAANNFSSSPSQVIDGVTHTAVNPSFSQSMNTVPGTGIRIVTRATQTNFVPGTLTATRLLISLEDAGVKPGDDWIADFEWSQTLNLDDYGLIGTWLDNALQQGSGADAQTRYVTCGNSTSAPSGFASLQVQAEGFRDLRSAWDTAIRDAMQSRVRLFGGRSGLEVAASSDGGVTWLRVGQIAGPHDAIGLQGTIGDLKAMWGIISFNLLSGGIGDLERLRIYHRPQPE